MNATSPAIPSTSDMPTSQALRVNAGSRSSRQLSAWMRCSQVRNFTSAASSPRELRTDTRPVVVESLILIPR